jgi:hypothetical protein
MHFDHLKKYERYIHLYPSIFFLLVQPLWAYSQCSPICLHNHILPGLVVITAYGLMFTYFSDFLIT